MKVLITGITGMIGKHLSDLLINNSFEVAGISRATALGRYHTDNKLFKHYQGDILDTNFLEKVWQDWKPEVIFHLAAQAYNGLSWEAEDTTYLLNIQGARNVFNVCKKYSPDALIIPACSSAEYGFVSEEKFPIEENTPLHPITPYGVSKAAMEMMAIQYHLNYGLKVIIPRLFIHVGPDHPPVTALQAFAMQLAKIKLGLQAPIINVGNLSTARDFVDVRDGAKALLLLVQKGNIGDTYNICTGKAWTIQSSLELLIKISGLDVEIKQDKGLFRPSDEKLLVGDNTKLLELGWQQEIKFEKTLEDIYLNWLTRLKK